jgi:hypothetical protein
MFGSKILVVPYFPYDFVTNHLEPIISDGSLQQKKKNQLMKNK